MHLYIITRGIKKDIDDFITQLQGKYLPMKYRLPNETQLKDVALQVGVRPIQPWEIVFPEEHLELMCQTLFRENETKPQHKWQEKFIFMLRKLLKLEKIPKYTYNPETAPGMPIARNNIEVIGVGMKKDYYVDLSGNHIQERKEGCYEGI